MNDFTQITDFEVSESDVMKIAAIDHVAAKSNENIIIAIAANNGYLLEWISFYLKKMKYSLYKEIRIFNTPDDAYNWIRGSIKESMGSDSIDLS